MPKRNRLKRRKKNNTGAYVVIGIVLVIIVVAIAAFTLHGNAGNSGSTSSSTNPQLTYLTVIPQNPVLGSKNASVTIFEFGDFQCTYCDQWYKTTEPQIVQNLINTGTAKLVWRDFDYYGTDSTYASKAAYAAGEQGKFWQFYDLLYSNQGTPNSGWASPSNLEKFAQSLNLNMVEFNQSFNSTNYSSLIQSNYSAGQSLGVSGTPTFFVVGPTGKFVQITGAQPYSAFSSAVSSVSSG